MNPDSYFETDPWDYAVEAVQKGGLGPIAAFTVQAGGIETDIEKTVQQWQRRLDGLFGKLICADKLCCDAAVSLLLRYEGPVIGRIFIDRSGKETFCNFEFVGAQGLLIWKPDTHSLARLKTESRDDLTYQHPYAVSLKGEVVR